LATSAGEGGVAEARAATAAATPTSSKRMSAFDPN
jgi:hypothetical protein